MQPYCATAPPYRHMWKQITNSNYKFIVRCQLIFITFQCKISSTNKTCHLLKLFVIPKPLSPWRPQSSSHWFYIPWWLCHRWGFYLGRNRESCHNYTGFTQHKLCNNMQWSNNTRQYILSLNRKVVELNNRLWSLHLVLLAIV